MVGSGDITGLGDADIVIQNSSGNVRYANMEGGVFQGWVEAVNVPGWKVIAVEDVLGNGFDDIVIQNPTNGQILYANMTGGTFQGWGVVTNAPGYSGTATEEPPVAESASTSVSTQSGAGLLSNDGGFQGGNGSATTAFNTDPGALISENMPPVGTLIHEPMFGAWLDGNSSSDGGPAGGTSNNTPNLPIGSLKRFATLITVCSRRCATGREHRIMVVARNTRSAR